MRERRTKVKKLGFIGLGLMGQPMAVNLLKAGYKVAAYDRNPEKVEKLVEAGAVAATGPRQVAEVSDVIITMLPNSPHVKEVVLGENGIIEGARSGQYLVDMSSIAPL